MNPFVTLAGGVAKAVLFSMAFLLSACAGYSGYTLKPGVATLPEVVATMGEPAMRWDDPGGRVQLAYPRGPSGTKTFMAYLGADGLLVRIEEVLNGEHFARIVSGKSRQDDVLRTLGPPNPSWTAYFAARDELVWQWRFCDSWMQTARFDVLFDGSTGVVRSTQVSPDYFGRRIGMPCSK
jgi:hypothetical protein